MDQVLQANLLVEVEVQVKEGGTSLELGDTIDMCDSIDSS